MLPCNNTNNPTSIWSLLCISYRMGQTKESTEATS